MYHPASSRVLIAILVSPYKDRPGARRVAIAVVQVRPASRELVAAMCASACKVSASCASCNIPHIAHALGTVAEPDIVRGSEASRVGGIEARRPTGIHGAGTAAHVVDAPIAVRDRRIEGLARGQALGRIDTRNWVAYEGELGVGRLEPIDHLLLCQDVGDDLRLCVEAEHYHWQAMIEQALQPGLRQPRQRGRRGLQVRT